MATIEPTTAIGQRRQALADWAEAKAQPLLDEIAADIAALPTADNAAVKDMIERDLIRQRKIIRGLIRILNGFAD